jgi:CheY-like chemotaxis protein
MTLTPEPRRELVSVLVVEDEALIGMMLEDMLHDLGIGAVLIAMDRLTASEMASTASFDCAILDVYLHGKVSFLIADILVARGIPFMFSTGAVQDVIDERFKDRPVLAKPFGEEALRTVLAGILPARA